MYGDGVDILTQGRENVHDVITIKTKRKLSMQSTRKVIATAF